MWIVCFFVLATVRAFVPQFSIGVGVSTRATTLLSLKATNTTTAQGASGSVVAPDQDALAALLSQGDPNVDAPLPPAYTACPFNGVLGGPKSFLRVASQALKAPKVFSFVHKNKPVAEISGGAEVQELLNQEFTALQSNAMAGHSQAACGTNSLRTAQNRREHTACCAIWSACPCRVRPWRHRYHACKPFVKTVSTIGYCSSRRAACFAPWA